jgi:uncharacterized membrane protein YqjE
MGSVGADVERADLRDRPIGEVVKNLTSDLSLLVRQEAELAKSELAEKAKKATPGMGMIVGAGVVALLAGGALTACAILVLALFLPAWLSALLVAAVMGAIAYGLAVNGKSLIERAGSPVPEQTIETVKEDVAWVKQRATSARR